MTVSNLLLLKSEDIEAYPCEADFISEVVEAADAILGVFVVVVLHEAKSKQGVSDISNNLAEVEHTLCKAHC